MPLPDLSAYCVDIVEGPGRLCITFPGGVEVCSGFLPSDIADPTEHVKALIGQLNTALAPLQPVFNIIDVCLAIVKCVEAIPDALVELDPTAIARCIPDLLSKLDALLKIIPQLSVPFLIRDFLDHLITFLQGLRSRLQLLIDKQERLLRAETKAGNLNAIGLQNAVDCAKANLTIELALLNEGLEPINRVLSILNALLEIAQLPCIPSLGQIGGIDEIYLEPLDVMIDLLTFIRSLIPTPGFPALVAAPPCEDFVTPEI
jgi:hypothetical protein